MPVPSSTTSDAARARTPPSACQSASKRRSPGSELRESWKFQKSTNTLTRTRCSTGGSLIRVPRPPVAPQPKEMRGHRSAPGVLSIKRIVPPGMSGERLMGSNAADHRGSARCCQQAIRGLHRQITRPLTEVGRPSSSGANRSTSATCESGKTRHSASIAAMALPNCSPRLR